MWESHSGDGECLVFHTMYTLVAVIIVMPKTPPEIQETDEVGLNLDS